MQSAAAQFEHCAGMACDITMHPTRFCDLCTVRCASPPCCLYCTSTTSALLHPLLTGGHLHTGGEEVLGVTGGLGVPLTELLDVIQLQDKAIAAEHDA